MGRHDPSGRRAGHEPERVPVTDPSPAAPTLAAKIDRLIHAGHPAGGEHGYRAVASAIRRRGGPTISNTYLWQLHRGTRDNPTKRHLEALADFFGVPPSYFFDDPAAARFEAELGMLAAMRDAGVRHLAARAHGLSPRSLAAITDMVELARRFERLDEPDGRPTVPADGGPSPEP